MAIKLGMEAKLFYKVGGQSGGGAWTELANVRDVTLTLEAGEADVTTRANQGWRATVATLKEACFTGWKPVPPSLRWSGIRPMRASPRSRMPI